MDASGDQSDEQQASEKPIGIEEQKTIERQEAEAEQKGSTEEVNEPPATTTEEIIGKAQEQVKSEANVKQSVKEKSKPILKDQSTKLFDKFTKHFQASKVTSGNTTNMLKQIQKRLIQIEKTNIIRNKQQGLEIATQKAVQELDSRRITLSKTNEYSEASKRSGE